MREKLTAQYNSWYTSTATDETMYGTYTPLKAIQRLASRNKYGSVLDVGGGEGRNALYLAQHGFDVTVNDISEVGLQKIKRIAKEYNVTVKTILDDITQITLSQPYDHFLFSYVLHHLNTEEVINTITKTKGQTLQGGSHLIMTFINKGELYERNEFKQRFYPSETILRELYADWNIIECLTKETTTCARRKDGSLMSNWIITFVAQKTGN